MMTGWRIVPKERANDAFIGEGARRFGGRWNSVGTAVIYGSESKALAALEQLVHLNPRTPNSYLAFRFRFSDSLAEHFPAKNLPEDWRQEPPPSSTQQIGDLWVRGLRSAVLIVPSIIITAESNLLLNPAHPDFKKITIERPEDFSFDLRLLT
jgi:RES domain-containing protein